MNTLQDRDPVIVGIGELTQRTREPGESLEPLALMAAALRAAEADAGVPLLHAVDSLDVVAEYSWPYVDPTGQLCEQLGLRPARSVYGKLGGESPMRFLHEAALRIRRGETEVAAIVGAEAQYAVTAALKRGVTLPWSPRDEHAKLVRGVDYLHPLAVKLGVASPATVYPFYENAMQAAWGQTPAQGRTEAGAIWERCAAAAAANPYAWQREAAAAGAITAPSATNRLVAWPYTVRMVANPQVNQGAALLLTSVGKARQMGIADERMVHVWCGAAAQEPVDYLQRDRYTHVPAQEAVLERILEQVGDAGAFRSLELYSCFPIVPKMARSTLALSPSAAESCAGGLSFFGAPLNNYMTHATAAMVRELRGHKAAHGLLYGQGGYMTGHHAVVLGSQPSRTPLLADDYSVQSVADSRRGEAPPLTLDYRGPAAIETHTVLYQRDGSVQHGVVILRTPQHGRLLARVPAEGHASIAALTDPNASPIGYHGNVTADADGHPLWGLVR